MGCVCHVFDCVTAADGTVLDKLSKATPGDTRGVFSYTSLDPLQPSAVVKFGGIG